MAKEIRLGLVGFGQYKGSDGKVGGGRGSGLFKQSVECFDGVTPAAVCDTAPAALDMAGRVYPGIGLFESFDDMLARAGIDALIIGTPATCHAPFAEKALTKNIHVLSEIPSVWTAEESKALWDAHLKSRAIYMTGSNPNFMGYIDAAVDLKRRGLFGDPIFAEAEYIHDCRKLWELTPWRKTLAPIHYCTHSLGPLLRLIDEDLEWASCFDSGSHINRQDGQHDVMAALFRTRSNVLVRLLVSFINEVGCHHQYRLFTTKGRFERTAPHYTSMGFVPAESPRTLFYSKDLPLTNNLIELPVAEMPPALEGNPKATGHGGIDYAMLDAFFKAIREGLPSPVSLKDGLRMSLPGIYAAESARKGGELVRISYPWSENI